MKVASTRSMRSLLQRLLDEMQEQEQEDNDEPDESPFKENEPPSKVFVPFDDSPLLYKDKDSSILPQSSSNNFYEQTHMEDDILDETARLEQEILDRVGALRQRIEEARSGLRYN